VSLPDGLLEVDPIEHRLFSQISCNWAGVPLRTWDTVLAFVRGTHTATGLVVQAVFNPSEYPTGQRVSDAAMAALDIEHHPICPTWNYTIRPRTPVPRSTELREPIP
jgi:hypothetical protein